MREVGQIEHRLLLVHSFGVVLSSRRRIVAAAACGRRGRAGRWLALICRLPLAVGDDSIQVLADSAVAIDLAGRHQNVMLVVQIEVVHAARILLQPTERAPEYAVDKRNAAIVNAQRRIVRIEQLGHRLVHTVIVLHCRVRRVRVAAQANVIVSLS